MTSDKPVISVVIPAFNEEKYIALAITSVQSQKVAVPFEIIVINNVSTDNTAAIAKELGVKVVAEVDKGLANARQQGLDEAKGEYVLYIDADSRLKEGMLQELYTYFQQHPSVVAVSCQQDYYDGRLIDKLGMAIFSSILIPLGLIIMRLLRKPDFFIASCIMVKTEKLRAAGGINKDFPFFGDDTSMSLRMATQGTVRFLPKLAIHTSARRLKREGILFTLFRYWGVFFLMQFRSEKTARKFAARYNS